VFKTKLEAVMVGVVGFMMLIAGLVGLGGGKRITEVQVRNPYRVGITLKVICDDGDKRWRTRYLPPRGTMVLMLEGRRCRVMPKLGR